MSTENGGPRQKPLPCSVNLLRHQVTQLRNGLVKAIEQTSLANPEAEGAVNQLRLALKAVEEALLLLQDCEVNHEVPKRESCEEHMDGKPLTIIDRARIFQSWDASRRQEKQGRQQSQRSVKRKLSEWKDLCTCCSCCKTVISAANKTVNRCSCWFVLFWLNTLIRHYLARLHCHCICSFLSCIVWTVLSCFPCAMILDPKERLAWHSIVVELFFVLQVPSWLLSGTLCDEMTHPKHMLPVPSICAIARSRIFAVWFRPELCNVIN